MRVVGRSCSLSELSAVLERSLTRSGTTWIVPVALVTTLMTVISVAGHVDLRLGVMSPHPFWIAVLIACLQGGVTAALVTTVVVVGIALGSGIAPPLGGEDFYDHGWRVSLDPLLWLAASVVIGGVRGRHLSALAALEARTGEAERQRLAIARAFGELKLHCEDLERERACASGPASGAVTTTLDRLLVAPNAERPQALAGLIAHLVGDTDYAVLEPSHEGLAETLSWRSAPSSRAAMLLSHAAADELERRRSALSILRDTDVALLGNEGVVAAPVLHPRDGRLLGALVLCRSEASLATPGVEMLLGVVGRAVATVMAADGAVVSLEKRRRLWRFRSAADDAASRAVDLADRRASEPYG